MSRDGKRVALDVKVNAGDFATVFALADAQQGIRKWWSAKPSISPTNSRPRWHFSMPTRLALTHGSTWPGATSICSRRRPSAIPGARS
ncbi:hypothetical protein QNM99_00420 [Pseudomonas sp. PCH446]